MVYTNFNESYFNQKKINLEIVKSRKTTTKISTQNSYYFLPAYFKLTIYSFLERGG